MFRRAEEYLYATISERKHAVEVPKIIHFIWHGKKIPQKYLDNIRLVRELSNKGFKNVFSEASQICLIIR